MSGSLIKLEEVTVSSAVASVTLGDDKWDSSYDVYMVKVNNVAPDGANRQLYMRVTKSGTADTTSNYDYAYKALRADTTFGNVSNTNQTFWQTSNYANSTGTSQTMNGVFYLFNFNSSEYSFVTNETANLTGGDLLIGAQGGGVHTVASASDGIYFYYNADNIDTGSTFTLYGLKK